MKLYLLALCGIAASSLGQSVHVLHLMPPTGMTRADLYYADSASDRKAVLILCPGCNGSGEELVKSPAWREFAARNHLGLVGLSFASPLEAIQDGTGYYDASKGSGEKLLEGIKKIYGNQAPLLLYGFSGGAHFTSSFEEWNPVSVLAWCADSAEWWNPPSPARCNPPGIVACGDQDSQRYGASLVYFKQGRAEGKPWLWISLANLGHSGSRTLDDFVKKYFSVTLDPIQMKPVWVDVDTKQEISSSTAELQPELTGYLPSTTLFPEWNNIHSP